MIELAGNISSLAALFLFGAAIGSFLNVCIYRLPLGLPLVFSRSKCLCCGKSLTILDLVPIISYVVLKGKCRHCRNSVSRRYPLVEILSGFLFLLCYVKFDFSVHFLAAVILASFLIVISFIDLNLRLIFDKMVVLLILAGVAVFLLKIWLGAARFGELWDYLLAAAVGGGFLFIIALVTGGAMGLGDVKLALALGFWLGTKFIVLALFLAFLSGAAAGAILVVLRLKSRKDCIPFAPFISVGAIISMLYGCEIINWYLCATGLR